MNNTLDTFFIEHSSQKKTGKLDLWISRKGFVQVGAVKHPMAYISQLKCKPSLFLFIYYTVAFAASGVFEASKRNRDRDRDRNRNRFRNSNNNNGQNEDNIAGYDKDLIKPEIKCVRRLYYVSEPE